MTSNPGSLAGAVALVTGGGTGIGRSVAARLAADGAAVTICGRTEATLAEAVDAIRAEAGEADVQYVVADVTYEAAVAHAVEAAARFGDTPLGIVVANAGGSESMGPITQLDVSGWERTLAVNLTGTMLLLKHGGAALVAGGGGAFVAVSSLASTVSHPWFGAYGPAKAGINMLCRQAADELGPSDVRVNTVCPGLIRTDLVQAIIDDPGSSASYRDNTPLTRVGEPDEVAALVRFLVGPESTWITGQDIHIDGGQSIRRGPSLRSLLEPLFGEAGLRGVIEA